MSGGQLVAMMQATKVAARTQRVSQDWVSPSLDRTECPCSVPDEFDPNDSSGRTPRLYRLDSPDEFSCVRACYLRFWNIYTCRLGTLVDVSGCPAPIVALGRANLPIAF